ncbi:hypothetical protein EIP86_006437 [Pleurotus ostreatoroseus]|nr:hypothetical protein EIP86_006437 [Pleurotus ostreatoroseus]
MVVVRDQEALGANNTQTTRSSQAHRVSSSLPRSIKPYPSTPHRTATSSLAVSRSLSTQASHSPLPYHYHSAYTDQYVSPHTFSIYPPSPNLLHQSSSSPAPFPGNITRSSFSSPVVGSGADFELQYPLHSQSSASSASASTHAPAINAESALRPFSTLTAASTLLDLACSPSRRRTYKSFSFSPSPRSSARVLKATTAPFNKLTWSPRHSSPSKGARTSYPPQVHSQPSLGTAFSIGSQESFFSASSSTLQEPFSSPPSKLKLGLGPPGWNFSRQSSLNLESSTIGTSPARRGITASPGLDSYPGSSPSRIASSLYDIKSDGFDTESELNEVYEAHRDNADSEDEDPCNDQMLHSSPVHSSPPRSWTLEEPAPRIEERQKPSEPEAASRHRTKISKEHAAAGLRCLPRASLLRQDDRAIPPPKMQLSSSSSTHPFDAGEFGHLASSMITHRPAPSTESVRIRVPPLEAPRARPVKRTSEQQAIPPPTTPRRKVPRMNRFLFPHPLSSLDEPRHVTIRSPQNQARTSTSNMPFVRTSRLRAPSVLAGHSASKSATATQSPTRPSASSIIVSADQAGPSKPTSGFHTALSKFPSLDNDGPRYASDNPFCTPALQTGAMMGDRGGMRAKEREDETNNRKLAILLADVRAAAVSPSPRRQGACLIDEQPQCDAVNANDRDDKDMVVSPIRSPVPRFLVTGHRTVCERGSESPFASPLSSLSSLASTPAKPYGAPNASIDELFLPPFHDQSATHRGKRKAMSSTHVARLRTSKKPRNDLTVKLLRVRSPMSPADAHSTWSSVHDTNPAKPPAKDPVVMTAEIPVPHSVGRLASHRKRRAQQPLTSDTRAYEHSPPRTRRQTTAVPQEGLDRCANDDESAMQGIQATQHIAMGPSVGRLPSTNLKRKAAAPVKAERKPKRARSDHISARELHDCEARGSPQIADNGAKRHGGSHSDHENKIAFDQMTLGPSKPLTRTLPSDVQVHADYPRWYRRFPMPAPVDETRVAFTGNLAGASYTPPRGHQDLYTPRFVKGRGATKNLGLVVEKGRAIGCQ